MQKGLRRLNTKDSGAIKAEKASLLSDDGNRKPLRPRLAIPVPLFQQAPLEQSPKWSPVPRLV